LAEGEVSFVLLHFTNLKIKPRKMRNTFRTMVAAIILFASYQKENMQNKTTDNSSKPSSLTKEMVEENGNNPDETAVSSNTSAERTGLKGHVYIETNDAAGNAIIVYNQQSNGELVWASQTWSGGKGAGAGLGSQGALTIDKTHQWLFAVNAGSNSVSSFKIQGDGSLKLTDTKSSGGIMPISLTVHGEYLYVVNSTSSDISGFKIWGDGKLQAIQGSYQKLSNTSAGPAEIAFSPGGAALFITEKATNKITAFAVNSNGVAYNKVVNTSTGNTPFGFDFARDKYLIVTNADGGNANTSTCTSYRGLDNLYISPVNGKVANGQTAVCWVATAKFGRFAYTANTGSNNITSYFIDAVGNIYFIPWFTAAAGQKPADIIVSEDNRFVYNINGGNHTIGEYRRGLLGGLHNIGYISSIPNFAAGLVAY